ncbi:MAG: hypothetical protein IJT50_05160 [Lentisphaeria bacterium]|nr:hypothetical protein [Lentisphaeria bacterium]
MKQLLFGLSLVCAAVLAAAGSSGLTEELDLKTFPSLKWRGAVASASPGTMRSPLGGKTVTFTYPIIYDASGKPAKTSWPRCTVTVPPQYQNWGAYDFLEFSVYTTFNRSDEEYLPVSLSCSSAKTRQNLAMDIRTLRQNEWVKVVVPLRKMAKKEPIKSMQIHLNARRYFPNDKLVLHLGDFKLVRITQWQVSAFKMTAPAIFSDRQTLPLAFELLGPGEESKVPFRITDKSGKKVRDIQLPCKRGFAYRTLEIGALAPGDYIVSVFPDDEKRQHSAAFKVIPSPWKK